MNSGLKWKLIAGFILVFIAGGVTGGFVAATTIRSYFLAGGHHGVAAERMRDRLKSQLNLTPEQATKISPIIDKTTAQLEEIRSDTARRVHETFNNFHEQVAANLTPEQQTKFEEMRRRHHRMMERFHRRRGAMPASAAPSQSP
jgi:Spy/CpxP family protein refolding chaperone